MPLWTLFGLRQGKATTAWPDGASAGQEGVLGMPRFEPERCAPECEECAAVCPTAAITVEAGRRRQRAARGRLRTLRRLPALRRSLSGGGGAAVLRLGVRRPRARSDLILAADRRSRAGERVGGAAPGSAAACISVMSMPVPATAANPNCRRSTIRSTICIASAFSSRRRRVLPTCCWSPGRSPMRCANRCGALMRRCRSRGGSWPSAPARCRAASPAAAMPAATASKGCCRSIFICPAARPTQRRSSRPS